MVVDVHALPRWPAVRALARRPSLHHGYDGGGVYFAGVAETLGVATASTRWSLGPFLGRSGERGMHCHAGGHSLRSTMSGLQLNFGGTRDSFHATDQCPPAPFRTMVASGDTIQFSASLNPPYSSSVFFVDEADGAITTILIGEGALVNSPVTLNILPKPLGREDSVQEVIDIFGFSLEASDAVPLSNFSEAHRPTHAAPIAPPALTTATTIA